MDTTKAASSAKQWSAEQYAHNARFVSDLGVPVLKLLSPQAGEFILDLGCGDGALTQKLVAAGARVLGVDASGDMVAAAKKRGLNVRQAQAQSLPFENQFDAVFSNAALHWMTDSEAVVASVARALKPSGRFVGEFGGHGNVAAICTAMLAAIRLCGIDRPLTLPWYYPTDDEYRTLLESHGFKVDYVELIPRPTPLPTGLRGWLETFGDAMLIEVDPSRRSRVYDQAIELLRPSLCDASGRWSADYVRLRFHAVLQHKPLVKDS